LTGERRDSKQIDILPVIHDKYNVKIYIPDAPDHTGNRNIEVSGEHDKVVLALEELFNFLRDKAPGTNLMMNPLYYASAMGWQKYSDFAYPGEVQRPADSRYPAQHSSYGYPPQQMHSYPPQYPPQQRPYSQPHQDMGRAHYSQHGSESRFGPAPHADGKDQKHHSERGKPEDQKGQDSRFSYEDSKERKSAERKEGHSQEQKTEPGKDVNPEAHKYAEHYSKTLKGPYQYYYDYYMKTYAK